MWTFSFCSNARSFDRPTVAKPGEKIKVPIFIRRKGADVFRPALAAGGSLMAYKCLLLCGLFSFFKGFGENLFHAGFQFIQIEGRSLHGKTENFLLLRVGEIALIVLEHPLLCIQNFPEGAIISMPLRAERMKKGRAFWGGVLSGIVEPIRAVLTILAAGIVVPALPYLLSFAAGAMLYVVVEELIPEMSQGQHSNVGTVFFAVGFSVMTVLDVALG